MSNWSDLKKAVANVIKTNGNQEITGQKLQDVLNNIISNLGKNYQFVDIATPSTNPGTPDGNVFYIAYSKGTYTNFSGITLSYDEVAFLLYNGSWTKKKIGLATEEFLNAFYSSVCYLECNTAANTANKTISNSNYVLTKNCRFAIKMINANTNASPTLNINNTGAKPILYNGKNADNVNSWSAGDLLDVFYDGNNYHFYKMLGGSGGNMILKWDTDIATTRKQVKASDRKAGMQISYLHTDNGWTNEQYIGTAVTDTEWVKDTNWKKIASIEDTYELKNYIQWGVDTVIGNINNNGELESNITSYVSTEFINITLLSSAKININNQYCKVTLYDSNKVFISQISIASDFSSYSDYLLPITDYKELGAAYIRITNSDKSTVGYINLIYSVGDISEYITKFNDYTESIIVNSDNISIANSRNFSSLQRGGLILPNEICQKYGCRKFFVPMSNIGDYTFEENILAKKYLHVSVLFDKTEASTSYSPTLITLDKNNKNFKIIKTEKIQVNEKIFFLNYSFEVNSSLTLPIRVRVITNDNHDGTSIPYKTKYGFFRYAINDIRNTQFDCKLGSTINTINTQIFPETPFKRIAWFGTSIEKLSGYPYSIGIELGTNVIDYSVSGAHVTAWWALGYDGDSSAKKSLMYEASLSKKEKESYWQNEDWGTLGEEFKTLCYDQSVMVEALKADLIVIGTWGINDRPGHGDIVSDIMPDSYIIEEGRSFDRKTIYGAYNYILKRLFTKNPLAQVVILGQYSWARNNSTNGCLEVNEIQRKVAERWGIPFWDMGNYSAVNEINSTVYTQDNIHVINGAPPMIDYLVKRIKEAYQPSRKICEVLYITDEVPIEGYYTYESAKSAAKSIFQERINAVFILSYQTSDTEWESYKYRSDSINNWDNPVYWWKCGSNR